MDITISDETLTLHHLTLKINDDLSVDVHPERTSNPTLIGGVVLVESRRLDAEQPVFAGSTQFVIRSATFETVGQRDQLGQIAHNPSPYRQPIVRERKLDELRPPPEQPGARRFSIAAIVVPLAGAAFLTLYSGQVQSLFLAALSPLMIISNYISEGRHTKKSYANERAKFQKRMEQRVEEIDIALASERQERLLAAPDIPMLARQAAGRLARLWERPRGSANFFGVALGTRRSAVQGDKRYPRGRRRRSPQ